MMKRAAAATLALLALGSCTQPDHKTHIYLQRFFGECGAEYGNSIDTSKAEGECGIITSIIARFNAENPDLHIDVNVVAWPGYPQLTAQMAARDPPDLVTMHEGVISDYQAAGLLEPIDSYLRQARISPDSFTDAARRGVTVAGRVYGLPIDTHGGLFHVNTALFEKAGLMRGGKPMLPDSADQLIIEARQFEQRTGKPYLIQSLVGDPAGAARNLYTYMMAQGAVLFTDPKHIKLNTPAGIRVATFFRQINLDHIGTLNMDTPAAIAAFMNGEGGIYPTGTWMIGTFEEQAETPGRPLYNSYQVFPYPRLWGERVEYVSGHSWVVPARKRTPEQRQAIARFFRFMADHDYDWARTGHIPAFKAVLDDPRFKRLPHRADIAALASMGRPLPGYVLRQSAIEGIVGEEAAAAFTGQKTIPQALAEAERRVDILLSQAD
jgi:multiple sugar transport system substrate-binding protein